MILTIAEIKTLAQFCGLVLTDGSVNDKDQEETEISVVDCPKCGLIDADANKMRQYEHAAYFYEYPEEGCIGLGKEIPRNAKEQVAADGGDVTRGGGDEYKDRPVPTSERR